MRKSTARKSRPKTNVLSFPEPVTRASSKLVRDVVDALQDVEQADMNMILTGGNFNCILHELPEGFKVVDEHGNTLWRLFKVTD